MTLTPAQLALVLTLTAAAGLGGYLGYRHWRKVQARRQRLQQVAVVAFDMMQDVLVPDGSEGHLHLDFLLLTSAGMLVVDLRDVPGMIFGSESMDEWTVMDGVRRSTFPNPLGPLYDRIAAVKLAAGKAPPTELFPHLLIAGKNIEALRCGLEAATALRTACDMEKSLDVLTRISQLPEWAAQGPEAEFLLAEVLAALGRNREAEERLNALAARPDAGGPLLCDTLALLAMLRLKLGRPAEAGKAADEALRAAKEIGRTAVMPQLMHTAAQLLYARGDYRQRPEGRVRDGVAEVPEAVLQRYGADDEPARLVVEEHGGELAELDHGFRRDAVHVDRIRAVREALVAGAPRRCRSIVHESCKTISGGSGIGCPDDDPCCVRRGRLRQEPVLPGHEGMPHRGHVHRRADPLPRLRRVEVHRVRHMHPELPPRRPHAAVTTSRRTRSGSALPCRRPRPSWACTGTGTRGCGASCTGSRSRRSASASPRAPQ